MLRHAPLSVPVQPLAVTTTSTASAVDVTAPPNGAVQLPVWVPPLVLVYDALQGAELKHPYIVPEGVKTAM
jgi:hypothetical protein